VLHVRLDWHVRSRSLSEAPGPDCRDDSSSVSCCEPASTAVRFRDSYLWYLSRRGPVMPQPRGEITLVTTSLSVSKRSSLFQKDLSSRAEVTSCKSDASGALEKAVKHGEITCIVKGKSK